jgi:hypothetical protein
MISSGSCSGCDDCAADRLEVAGGGSLGVAIASVVPALSDLVIYCLLLLFYYDPERWVCRSVQCIGDDWFLESILRLIVAKFGR